MMLKDTSRHQSAKPSEAGYNRFHGFTKREEAALRLLSSYVDCHGWPTEPAKHAKIAVALADHLFDALEDHKK